MSKEPIKKDPSGIKKTLTNIKKDVVYDWKNQHSKSKQDLEKEKHIKGLQLKEAIKDREDADSSIKSLIDEVVAMKGTLASRDGRIEELSAELEKEIGDKNSEIEEKNKQIKIREQVEEDLKKEKEKTEQLQSSLTAETQAKNESEALLAKEIEHRQRVEAELHQEKENSENLSQSLQIEQQDKAREITTRVEMQKEKMRETAKREELENFLQQSKHQIEKLKAEIETLFADLRTERLAKSGLESDKALLESRLAQSEAAMESVQDQLGNAASALQAETAQRIKLEEAFTREKTRGQEKSTQLQKVEADVARLKDEWEKESKQKADAEMKLMEESRRRTELEKELEELREEVEGYRNDRDENSVQKIRDHAMILEEKLQQAEEELESERSNKSAEIKEVMEKAIRQINGIREQLQKEQQANARLEAEVQKLTTNLKSEIEARQNGQVASDSELRDSNNKMKISLLEASQKVNKLQHDRDSLFSSNKENAEGLKNMQDKFSKIKGEYDELERQRDEDRKKAAEKHSNLEREMRELAKEREKDKKEAAARTQEIEWEKKRAVQLEQAVAKLRGEWELQGKSSSETITKLRDENVKLEELLEKKTEELNKRDSTPTEVIPDSPSMGGDIEFWKRKVGTLQAALDLTTKNNVNLQKQTQSTEDQHINLLEQIKTLTVELDDIMNVKVMQAQKIAKLQQENELMQSQLSILQQHQKQQQEEKSLGPKLKQTINKANLTKLLHL